MKSFFIAYTLLNLWGCASGNGTNETEDTAETKDTKDSNALKTADPYVQSEAIVTHISALLPFVVWRQASILGLPDNPDPCPLKTATEDGAGLIVTGGCTDQKGNKYSGLFQIQNTETGEAYDFSSFSMTHGSFSLAMDGDLHHDLEKKSIAANLQVEMADESRNLALQANYADYFLSDVLAAIEVLAGRSGSFVSEGSITITDVDDFFFNGTFKNWSECEEELDEMELVFSGERGTLTFQENAISCDRCTDWSSDSASGEICIL